MIDFIKYFPLKLRQAERNENVKGPSFSSAKTINLSVAGSRLSFKAPRHQPKYDETSIYVKNRDGIEGAFKSINQTTGTHTWVYRSVFFRGFGYRYPWFGGYKGELSLTVSIIKRHDKFQFKDFSFLHPRGFEYAITNYLNTFYGQKHKQDGEALYRAPLNWNSRSQLPVVSASFDIKPSNARLLYVFPITHHHFIEMDFSYVGVGGNIQQLMEDLALQIVDSVRLELGPQTQAMLDEIKTQCPDMTLTKDFPPLKWPIAKGDIENTPTINIEPPAADLFA